MFAVEVNRQFDYTELNKAGMLAVLAAKDDALVAKEVALESANGHCKTALQYARDMKHNVDRLELELTRTHAEFRAVEHTRILVETAAFRMWPKSNPNSSKWTSVTIAAKALAHDIKDKKRRGLCAKSKARLTRLVGGSLFESNRVERDVYDALDRVYKTLSTERHYIKGKGLNPGLYIGLGALPDRIAAALLILKAQEHNVFEDSVTFLNENSRPVAVLKNGHVNLVTNQVNNKKKGKKIPTTLDIT